MKTLYFIRHAESEANKKRILGSRLAYPLTKDGKLDSVRIALELKELTEIDRIISSPLKRAVQTAESFSKVFNIDIHTDERLTEQHLGKFSGMTYDDVKSQSEYETDPLNRWDWVPAGGGESYSMIADRITVFLNDIAYCTASNSILIVTHAVSLRIIIAALKNTLPEYPKDFPNNGEILKVEFSKLGNTHEAESLFLGKSREFNHNP